MTTEDCGLKGRGALLRIIDTMILSLKEQDENNIAAAMLEPASELIRKSEFAISSKNKELIAESFGALLGIMRSFDPRFKEVVDLLELMVAVVELWPEEVEL